MPPSAAPGSDAGSVAEVDPGAAQKAGNWPATAALIAGAAGFAVVPIAAALVFAVLGLRRARGRGWRAPGSGAAKSAAGLVLAAAWAAIGVYLLPHVVRAADPGCAAYKSAALGPYNKVIAEFNKGGRASADVRDLSAADAALRRSAARSASPGPARALSSLAAELADVRADIVAGRHVTRSVLRALNQDAARADAACGTLHV